MDIGLATLSDFQATRTDGTHHTMQTRMEGILANAVLADSVGLDHFAIGEHHTEDFVASSPAVVLAAIAAQTKRIRLTTAVSIVGVHDPVRLFQDFASVDLISHGRAELTVGRSAFAEPFQLFGYDLADYDALFMERLGLLLKLRDGGPVTWSGRFRAPLVDSEVFPAPVQRRMPIWIGVGGSPESAVRAGHLGLPMTLAYLGGPPERLAHLAGLYQAAGREAGTSGSLRLGVAVHLLVAPTAAEAESVYPYYHDFLRPKSSRGNGYVVTPEAFHSGMNPRGALMIGTYEHVLSKLLHLNEVVHFDRIQALVDWGGLPAEHVSLSIRALGQMAPTLRSGSGQ